MTAVLTPADVWQDARLSSPGASGIGTTVNVSCGKAHVVVADMKNGARPGTIWQAGRRRFASRVAAR
jgi:hypothetical protein